jgi:hypothetical protein
MTSLQTPFRAGEPARTTARLIVQAPTDNTASVHENPVKAPGMTP